MDKILIAKIYNQESLEDGQPVLTPDTVKILRGLLSLTPKALADLSSVKKNQLVAYEEGKRDLSKRDKNWLRSVFIAAGADIFGAQGHLQVTLDGTPIIENGVLVKEIANTSHGGKMRESRWDLGLSQNTLAKWSGISQAVISMIENNRHGKYHKSALMRLNCTLAA